MFRRRFLIAGMSLATLPLIGCGSRPSGALELAPDSTLYLVRHMDRDGEDLNARGRARAEALVVALEGAPLDAIYSPGFQRNLDSAAPLAAARGLEIQRRPQEAPTARLVRDGAGQSALWMGNKGNLTEIWEDLGLEGAPPLAYGDLFVVSRMGTGPVEIDRRRFEP